MVRGTVCFNAGLRRAVADRDPTVLRIFGDCDRRAAGRPARTGGARAQGLATAPAAGSATGRRAGVRRGDGTGRGLHRRSAVEDGSRVGRDGDRLLGFPVGELAMLGPGAPLTTSLERVARPTAQTLTELAGTAGNLRDALAAGRVDEISLPLFVAMGVIAGSAAVTRGPLRRPDAA